VEDLFGPVLMEPFRVVNKSNHIYIYKLNYFFFLKIMEHHLKFLQEY
jgi:hypothetical protein